MWADRPLVNQSSFTLTNAMAQPCFPFGDGKAGPRIAGHVADFLLAGQARARCA